jgi:hypothetical protein
LPKVIATELEQIAQRRYALGIGEKPSPPDGPPPGDEAVYVQAGKQNLVGLSFSGGGIRSATFNLGVLQGLAKLGLLKYIDYLSTVSGGGYIGSWFTAWIQRSGSASAAGGLPEVERHLHPERHARNRAPAGANAAGAAPEARQILHLRRFSNYLAPWVGLLSADMWVLLATYLRNLLICQLVLMPAAVAVLVLARLLMVMYHPQTPDSMLDTLKSLGFKCNDGTLIDNGEWILGGVVLVLWLVAAIVAFIGSGRVRPDGVTIASPLDSKRLQRSGLMWLVIVPVVLTAVLFCWFPVLRHYTQAHLPDRVESRYLLGMVEIPSRSDEEAGQPPTFREYFAVSKTRRDVFLSFAFAPALVVALAYLISVPFHRNRRQLLFHMTAAFCACVLGGVLLYHVWEFMIWLCREGPGEMTDYVHARAAARITTFGPPMVLGVITLTIFLGIALLRNSIGEELREWWSSLCARLMMFAAIWMVVNLIAIYATAGVLWVGVWVRIALASGWFASVIGGVAVAGGSRTSAVREGTSALDWVALLVPSVFIAGLLIGLSLFMHVVLDSPPNWQFSTVGFDWMRRDEPTHPPIRITHTKEKDLDPGVAKPRTERREVIEYSRVFDEPVATSWSYWLGIFNTDANHVPRLYYHLTKQDIAYLRHQRGLDRTFAGELYDTAQEAPKEEARADFIAHFECILDQIEEAAQKRPGGVTRDEVIEIAQDGEMIVFDAVKLFAKLLIALGVCVALFLLAALVVDVNRFSLQALYADRLTRCYLGASNRSRSPDPITGFDPSDDLPLAALKIKAEPAATGYNGPYLLVNTTMNLVSGEELAWQQRKAEAFLLSPLACGSADTGYCKTDVYGGGIRLSTAVSISGAAASPNSGYHSSPAVTALLTVFNARLGAWLGNPQRPRRWRDPSPNVGFLYLLKELFGRTTDTSAYVYLSDGGHFENLGLYELVRRRCRYIIVSDAGCDGKHTFEDLGGAIRKCRADFGIRIEIDLDALRLSGEGGRSRWHCAVGRIRYDDVDFGAIAGTLVYIKPSLTGDEPADVVNYAVDNPTFPHQDTADQFFDESQFESYRALGEHVAEIVFAESLGDLKLDLTELPATASADDIRNYACRSLFSSLSRRWFGMPPEYEARFLHTSEQFSELQRSMAEHAEMNRLTRSMYPELDGHDLAAVDGTPSDGAVRLANNEDCVEVHLLLRMVQVMETAWLSLNLDVHHAHPLNRGWMDIFHRWMSAPLFRKYWPMVRCEFARRFVNFCEKQIRIGHVEVVLQPLEAGARIPDILRDEFSAQWPEGKPFVGLQQRWQDAGADGWCWLIHTQMEATVEPTPPLSPDAPCGLILVTPEAADGSEPVYDFLVWIRGACRNSGIGRAAVRQVLRKISERLVPGRSCRLRVRLPVSELSGPGGKMIEAMWLTFYHNFDFYRVPLPKPAGDADGMQDILLERLFTAAEVAGARVDDRESHVPAGRVSP